MSALPARSSRGTVCALAAVILLLALGGFAAGTATADAVESGQNVTVYRVANGSVSGLEEVESAIRTGRAEQSAQVVMGEPLVATFESERLAGSMTEANGSTTARFLAALEGNATFRVIQTNPTPQVTRLRAVIGPENLTVYRNDTRFYAVLDSDALSFKHRDSSIWEANVTQGERFTVQFGYDLPEEWPRWSDPSSPTVEFVRSEEQLTTAEPTTTTTETTRTTTAKPTTTTTAATTTTAPTTTTQRPTTESPTTTVDTTSTDGDGAEAIAVDTPGFTAATTLLALLGFVLLARRS